MDSDENWQGDKLEGTKRERREETAQNKLLKDSDLTIFFS